MHLVNNGGLASVPNLVVQCFFFSFKNTPLYTPSPSPQIESRTAQKIPAELKMQARYTIFLIPLPKTVATSQQTAL
jgi:hypothetical protein